MQAIGQHEAVSGGRGPGADFLGFATSHARRRNEAKARMLLACWMAETKSNGVFDHDRDD